MSCVVKFFGGMESEVIVDRDAQERASGQVCVSAGAYGRIRAQESPADAIETPGERREKRKGSF